QRLSTKFVEVTWGRVSSPFGDSGKAPLDDAFPLLDGDDLIALQLHYLRPQATWPKDFDCINIPVASQAKMKTRILRGLIAHPALFLIVKSKIPCRDSHARTHSVAV